MAKLAMAANYDQLAAAIIQRFSQLLGTADAVNHARRVPTLNVSADGLVLSRVSREDFAALVKAYRAVGGSISIYFMKNAISKFSVDSPFDLPEELR